MYYLVNIEGIVPLIAHFISVVVLQATTGSIPTLVASRTPSKYSAASQAAPALTTPSQTARNPPTTPTLGRNYSQSSQKDTR